MQKNGERVIDFFVFFFPLVKSKERQTNCLPLMISHVCETMQSSRDYVSCVQYLEVRNALKKIKKFAIRKFEWYLYNIDAYVCSL